MRIVALVGPDDRRGLALAGVEASTPEGAAALEAALAEAAADPGVGLILLGAPLVALAPRAVRAPRVHVLPEGGGGAHAR